MSSKKMNVDPCDNRQHEKMDQQNQALNEIINQQNKALNEKIDQENKVLNEKIDQLNQALNKKMDHQNNPEYRNRWLLYQCCCVFHNWHCLHKGLANRDQLLVLKLENNFLMNFDRQDSFYV